MDMLGNQKMRQIITDHYQMSDEPQLMKRAIAAARYTYFRICTLKLMSALTYYALSKMPEEVGHAS